MSKISTQILICPNCQTKTTFKKYDSLNVTLEPELKEKLLSGELFTFTCPNCQTKATVLYDMLYHDMEQKLMIQYMAEEKNLVHARQSISKVLLAVHQLSSVDPLTAGYQIRYTADPSALYEKIRLNDAGLDDRIIELMKYILLTQQEVDYDQILFERKADGQLELIVTKGTQVIANAPFNAGFYNELDKMFASQLKEYPSNVDQTYAKEFYEKLDA